ncbi:MAG: sigma-54 dependent transcriptional regulator [Planctomycetota bacterium]|nr:sigma-54 dependent transcriptional regulator [Planctomycetota bacterium]
MARERILVIEDEKLIRYSLSERLSKEGYEVGEAGDGRTGLRLLGEEEFDLLVLDYRLPDTDGLKVLEKVRDDFSEVPVILMTAYSTVENAVEAMRLGAFSYLTKPFNMDEMVMNIQKALETTELRREVRRLRESHKEAFGMGRLIGQSPKMVEIYSMVEKITRSGASTILLQGESGTGKDLLAKGIHYSSDRANSAFMTITCSALPDQLLESELFGHEKGAFTDAKSEKKGLFHLADRGTVFLDEIGDMPLALQSKLLRFLEERAFKRVGGVKDIHVDVRIIAATNRDLEAEVKKERFREDLYYRLKIIPIEMPPLRDRTEDIPLLVKCFVDGFHKEFKKKVRGVSEVALAHLKDYPWPGNVRELRNAIERAMILGEKEWLGPEDFPLFPSRDRPPRGGALLTLPREGIRFEELEKDLVRQALEQTRGNQSKAARLLGMTRDQIRYRIEKFQLSREEAPSLGQPDPN